jgi:response regulator RpfG family c-di-GMP phosphodiesterase
MTYKLLIVDDEMPNLRLLKRLFRQDYHCLTASSGEEAIEMLSQHDVAILITDQRMPQMSGIELLKRTAEMRPHMARILLTGYTDVEALVEAINCGLVHTYITKPWNNDDLKLKVSRALEEYENNKKRHSLKVANDRLQMRLSEMKLGVANAFDALLRIKDEYSSEHACRVAAQATTIAAKMGISDEECADLSLAAALHRLGHVGTPDELLWKSGSQTSDERAIYHGHSERGARILSLVPELRNVADTILLHHENFDGSGYPRGLQGEQIPLACRIIRVADEYDLLTQPRALSASVSHDQAVRLLQERIGVDFDPAVVTALMQINSPPVEEIEEQPHQIRDWMVDLPADVHSELGETCFS